MAREDPVPEPVPNTVDPAYDPARRPVVDSAVSATDTEVVTRFSPARRAYELIYLVFAVICTLIVIRVVLKVLAANAASFTSFIYGVTDFFMAPFRGLLSPIVTGRSIFEPSAVIAILIYALIGVLLARVVAVMFLRDVTVAQSRRGRYRTY